MNLLLTPHQGRLSWEQVYEGWKSNRYQYRWEKYSLKLVPKQVWPVEETT